MKLLKTNCELFVVSEKKCEFYGPKKKVFISLHLDLSAADCAGIVGCHKC
jgi:hypothetical protein